MKVINSENIKKPYLICHSNLYLIKILIITTIIFCILPLHAIVFADIYIYIDRQGKMHFTKSPVGPNYRLHTQESDHKESSPHNLSEIKNIKEAQNLLKEAGFNPGLIDGILGQKTREAIKAFQLSIGVEITGIVDRKLIRELQKYVSEETKLTEKTQTQTTHQILPSVKIPKPIYVLSNIPLKSAKWHLNPPELFRKVQESIFTVIAISSKRDMNRSNISSQGSAIAISANKLLTNYHVIKEADKIFITLDNRETPATVIGQNITKDLCVLQISDNSLTPIQEIRKFDDLEIGEKVFTIGTPFGFEKSLGEGIISSLRVHRGAKYIQTTAQLSSGSSGGGLFDSKGNLIGITTFMVKDSQNLNFAVAIEEFWKE